MNIQEKYSYYGFRQTKYIYAWCYFHDVNWMIDPNRRFLPCMVMLSFFKTTLGSPYLLCHSKKLFRNPPVAISCVNLPTILTKWAECSKDCFANSLSFFEPCMKLYPVNKSIKRSNKTYSPRKIRNKIIKLIIPMKFITFILHPVAIYCCILR